jgi:hypothetical protein
VRRATRLLVVAAVGACGLAAPAQEPDEAEVEAQVAKPLAGDAERGDDRALERALVRQRGLVLRPGQVELEPDLDYLYRETDAVRRDTLTTALVARVGLPLGAQVDARAPFVVIDRSRGRTRSGFGDVSFGATKQLHVGGPGTRVPDVLLAARWKTNTGSSTGELAPGTGAHAFQALLTAVSRDDPLVLVGTAYYVWSRPAHGVARGDAVGATLTTLLAATPDSSLLVGLDVASFSATKVDGRTVPGTDRLSGLLNLGLTTIVSRDVYVSVTGAIGVTPAAPDFQLMLAFPFRL